jgi:tetratricopeptide (TPR) repeat protein
MLNPPDSHHLAAAIGWLELGNHSEAGEEISRISPEYREDPDVLEARWQVCAAGKSWDAALAAAQRLIEVAPDRVAAWLHLGYALRRSSKGSVQLAAEALRPAYDKFPDVPLVPYNLACYAAQLGQLEAATDWLKSAIKRSEQPDRIKKMALADEDLHALRKIIPDL